MDIWKSSGFWAGHGIYGIPNNHMSPNNGLNVVYTEAHGERKTIVSTKLRMKCCASQYWY